MNFLKVLATVCFLLSAFWIGAQEDVELAKRTEVKINGLYLILGGFELDYEYILNEESSIGFSATVFFDDDVIYNWGFTPHYRLFFGKQPALGFFVEGHASVFNADNYYIDFGPNGTFGSGTSRTTSAGIGISIGGKFKTSRDVVVEVVGGFGRVFSDEFIDGAYPRWGINIGKRF